MNKPKTKHKKRLCPECRGDKECLYSDPRGHTYPQKFDTCHTCKGEGLVMQYVKIWYEPIK